MALFTRLLKLNQGNTPLEDFLTEIVAHFFETFPEILEAWLKHLAVLPSSNYSVSYISTQKKYEPLEHHISGSRPDLQIGLSFGANQAVILIESKVGSQEGYQQLTKYAEILAAMTNIQERFLFYITRDFDPKEPNEILKNLDNSVKFKQIRWHEFYQFLQSQPDNFFINEITKFMEEYGMALGNQFSSVDVLALSNFPKALNLMEATLMGRVQAKLKEVLKIKSPKIGIKQLKERGWYNISGHANGQWGYGLGYDLNVANVTDYPRVRLLLSVSPNAKHRTVILNAMQEISQKHGWLQQNFDDPDEWARIIRQKSLRDFLSKEDHVWEIEEYFIQLLEEVAVIRDEYSHLPWLVPGQDNLLPESDE